MVGHQPEINRLVFGAVPDGGPLQGDKLEEIRNTPISGTRKGEVPMAWLVLLRFMMLPDAESMPMSARFNPMVSATIAFVMLVRVLFNQMQVRTRVTVMMVEKCRGPGLLRSGVKENSAPPSGLDENRLPTPASNYPSHHPSRDASGVWLCVALGPRCEWLGHRPARCPGFPFTYYVAAGESDVAAGAGTRTRWWYSYQPAPWGSISSPRSTRGRQRAVFMAHQRVLAIIALPRPANKRTLNQRKESRRGRAPATFAVAMARHCRSNRNRG
jgi:hypothetical protein